MKVICYWTWLSCLIVPFVFFERSLFTESEDVSRVKEATIWKQYKKHYQEGTKDFMLPDYSHAGYMAGEKGIPNVTKDDMKVFHVTNYGAFPNDDKGDVEGIQKAIHAAASNKGGIVRLPPGEFLFNVTPKHANDEIFIRSSRIILRGSGAGKDGTVFHVKHPFLRNDGTPWPPRSFCDKTLVKVEANWGWRYPKNRQGFVASVIERAERGQQYVVVDQPEAVKKWKYYYMYCQDGSAMYKMIMGDKTPGPKWDIGRKKRIGVNEYHEVIKVEGNKVFFRAPIWITMQPEHKWVLSPRRLLEYVGVEDIYFKGNTPSPYKHLVVPDVFSMVKVTNAAHSWLRRCRFSSMSSAFSDGEGLFNSYLMLYVHGRRGHNMGGAKHASTHVLMGLIVDAAPSGQHHGVAVSHGTSGNTIWRVEGKSGYDLHSAGPRMTLIDLYTSSWVHSSGGAVHTAPNHLDGLTLWNLKRSGTGDVHVDHWEWWKDYGHCYVNPIIVGYHGPGETSFNSNNTLYQESIGMKVSPKSLYEAQLAFRLGKRPPWLDAALEEFKTFREDMDAAVKVEEVSR